MNLLFQSLLKKQTVLFFTCVIILLQLSACKKSISTIYVTPLIVWNQAPHNAFTDLIHFDNAYYCVFREGSSHTSYDGKLRILKSADSKTWSSFDLITYNNKDLRDPHFFVDNYGRLSILAFASDDKVRFNVIYKLTNSGFEYEKANVDNDYWIWSSFKAKGKLFSLGYNTKQPCFNSVFNSTKPKLLLFQNTDSSFTSFSKLELLNMNPSNFGCPNESSIILKDSTFIAIVRDDIDNTFSHIGYLSKPYTDWHWQNFPFYVRGPKLALLPDGKIFLAAASMEDYDRTYYAIINPSDYSVEKIKAFPSAGDTGYPGVIIEGNTALISYYSSHEGNARVYICRITY